MRGEDEGEDEREDEKGRRKEGGREGAGMRGWGRKEGAVLHAGRATVIKSRERRGKHKQSCGPAVSGLAGSCCCYYYY